MNCDQAVNSVDALGVLRSVTGLSSPACIDAGDVNCDGAVNAIDSLFILRFVAGLPVNLPGGCPPIGTASGLPLLNELLFLPSPGGAQFVELVNGGAGSVSMDALTLVDESSQSFTIPAAAPEIEAGDVLLVLFDGGSGVTGNVVHASPAGFLDADSGSVELRDGAEVLDRVAWGDGWANAVNLTRGGVVLGLEPGSPVGRSPANMALDRMAWGPSAPDEATPGEPNLSPGMGPRLPLDGALVDSAPFLTWYRVAGATGYQVQIAGDPGFGNLVVDETVESAGFSAGGLTPGGAYYWRVRPLSGGTGVFSQAQTFTVSGAAASAPSVPVVGPAVDITAHKDTSMLLLESPNQSGDRAWDRSHDAFDPDDPADAMNALPAAIATINSILGGSLSQDRIGFEVLKARADGPERDLGWGDAYTREQGIAALVFALGGASEFCSTNPGDVLSNLIDSLNSGRPVIAFAGDHPLAVSGYRTESQPPAPVKTFVTVHDPFLGAYEADSDKAGFRCIWSSPENAFPGFDEPEISTDTDGDGIVDFDETFRFNTSPVLADTDRDGRTDKQDVSESVFHHEFGYAGEVAFMGGSPNAGFHPRDYDADGADPERDCDNDNDGTVDSQDSDNYSAPPVSGSAVPCPGGGAVTVYWNSDTDFDVWTLPQPASNWEDASNQWELPGYDINDDPECLDGSQTTSISQIAPEAHYIGVLLWSPCLNDPQDPDDNGPSTASFTVTIQLPDGSVQQFSDTVTHEVDDWRLYGPFDFASPLPP